MSKKPSKKESQKFNLYQVVTERIIASLKEGVIPWEKPWKVSQYTGGPFPRNFSTGRPYRGINIMLLWSSCYNSPFWLTFNQAKELNGTVRKGEKGITCGIGVIAPHDLRRTCARLCHQVGGELEQIQFLLGHLLIQTTERYLG